MEDLLELLRIKMHHNEQLCGRLEPMDVLSATCVQAEAMEGMLECLNYAAQLKAELHEVSIVWIALQHQHF